MDFKKKTVSQFCFGLLILNSISLMAALLVGDEVVDERNILRVALEVGCSNLSQAVRSFILALVVKSSLTIDTFTCLTDMENKLHYCQTTVENIMDSKELHVSVKLPILTVILNELIRLQLNFPAASSSGDSHSFGPDNFGQGNIDSSQFASTPEGTVSIIKFLLLGVISRILWSLTPFSFFLAFPMYNR